MDRRRMDKPQLARERAVYDYLESLEKGDIDGIIASLDRALYDAPLDQMLVEAHQEYFQEEQNRRDSPNGNAEPIALPISPTPPSPPRARPQKRSTSPRWMSLLAAALLCVVLVSSFVVLLAWRQSVSTGSGPMLTPTATPAVTPTKTPAITPTKTPAITPTPSTTSPTSACTAFKTYAVPSGGQALTFLSGVGIVSTNSAWAVGTSSDKDQTSTSVRALIEHWDGRSWQIVSSPTVNGSLKAVAVVSANDVWAVGSQSVNKSLIEHWDGSTWKVVASPNASALGNVLNSIAVVSANDIWAVGSTATSLVDGNMRVPLIEHWDGNKWSLVSNFPTQGHMGLNAVTVASAQDIWVTGVALNALPPQGILAHWNGSNWKLFTDFPNVTGFTQVSATAPNDVWALGRLYDTFESVVEHWDGSTWSPVSLPDLPAKASLFGLTAVSAQDVWAVGIEPESSNGRQLLILRWNGQTWKRIEITVPNLQTDESSNALTIGHDQTWIVGITNGSIPLIEGCA